MSKTDLDLWTSTSTLDRLTAGKFSDNADLDQLAGGVVRNHLLSIRSQKTLQPMLINPAMELISSPRCSMPKDR